MKGPWRKLLEYASLFQNIKHKCLTQNEKLSSLGNIMASQEKETALNFPKLMISCSFSTTH